MSQETGKGGKRDQEKKRRSDADKFARSMEEVMIQAFTSKGLSEAIKWISINLEPSDVFESKDLSAWAEGAGYIKSE